MFKQTNKNSFFGYFLYDQVVPKDHFLRKLDAAVDFNFVNDLCKDAYPNLGKAGNRPYEPAMLLKILFLSFLFNVSLRDMEEQINDRLSFKWFLGLAATDLAPDHSTISVFRDRLREDIFKEIFNQIVKQADEKGLIHDRLKIIDSTDIAANVDLARLVKEHRDDQSDISGGKPGTFIDDNSPDQDARFGRKSDRKQIYGFKQHTAIDGDSGIIEALKVTPANVSDMDVVEPLLKPLKKSTDGRRKTKATLDKGYDTDKNHALLEKYGFKSFIIIKKNRTVKELKLRMKTAIYKLTIAERYKVEQRFADAKSNHGLAKCRWLGKWKTEIQAYVTATVLNCKRIVTLVSPIAA
jgi:IS5 family transposase